MTTVVPTMKNEKGVCDLFETVAVPDTSLHVGSIQLTNVPEVPSSTVSRTFIGRLSQTGGVVSTMERMTVKTDVCIVGILHTIKIIIAPTTCHCIIFIQIKSVKIQQ